MAERFRTIRGLVLLVAVVSLCACGGQPTEDSAASPPPPLPTPPPNPISLKVSSVQPGGVVVDPGTSYMIEASIEANQDESLDPVTNYTFEAGFNRSVNSARQ